jgi:O-antigen ligase
MSSPVSETAAGASRVWFRALDGSASWAPAVLLALTILTIPLEFTEVWFPNQIFQVGRFVMLALIVVFIGLAVVGKHGIRMPEWRLWVPAAVFVGYALVSALVTRTLPGLKTAGAALTYALVAFAIFNWTRQQRGQHFVWLWFAISCIGLSLVAFGQRITGGFIWRAPTFGPPRINATFGDPNTLGRVLVCMIVAGVALAPSIAARRTKLVMIAAVVLSAAVLPFTYSREAWVIGAFVLVLAVMTAQRRKEALLIAAVAVGAFVAVTLLVPGILARFGELQRGLTSGQSHLFNRPGLSFLNYLPIDSERHYLIAAGLQMFYDHPILGLGFGTFPAAMMGPYHDFILQGYITVNSHTVLITILAELGIVGLIPALWWLIEYFRLSVTGARRDAARRPYILAPLFAVVVILLESQIQARLIDEPYLWIFLGLAWAAMSLQRPSAGDGVVSRPIATGRAPQ